MKNGHLQTCFFVGARDGKQILQLLRLVVEIFMIYLRCSYSTGGWPLGLGKLQYPLRNYLNFWWGNPCRIENGKCSLW